MLKRYFPFAAAAIVACTSSTTPSPSGDNGGPPAGGNGTDGGATTPPGSGSGGGVADHDGGVAADGSIATAGDSGGGAHHDGGSQPPDAAPTPPTAGNTTSAASWFSPSMYFNQPIDTAPLDSSSATIISTLASNGGWGGSNGLQIDTSIDVYYADSTSKRVPFNGGNLGSTDSDIPATIPVAPGTAASSSGRGFESDTACSDDGDCHYLVVDPANHLLIEVYGAVFDGTTFTTMADDRSLAIWDWTKPYKGNLRGDVCTSADASGGLLAPLLFTAEEVAAGHIDHAIRFILPNTRIENKEYVRPATHGTGDGTSNWALSNGVPYGARLRLHAAFDTSGLTAGAKVVATALKKYGMILSDGGNIAFTAKSDAFSTTKWAGLLGNLDLNSIKPTDFDMVEMSYGTDAESSGTRHDFTSFDCTRNP